MRKFFPIFATATPSGPDLVEQPLPSAPAALQAKLDTLQSLADSQATDLRAAAAIQATHAAQLLAYDDRLAALQAELHSELHTARAAHAAALQSLEATIPSRAQLLAIDIAASSGIAPTAVPPLIPAAPTTYTLAEFNALTPQQKSAFSISGGRLTN